ncbi:hypothetical protein E2C01_023482 [Portunus trituberculatus]|uniref:Uncharacterized protein n=1 Tax=Portunus trituberculatus TaxID=210409 RepID=A0A5B7E821_PORTR|nr:hypothetical protein [Portunus trituberculatus]
MREVSRYFGSPLGEQSDLGTFLVPSSEGYSEAELGVAILNLMHCVIPLMGMGLVPGFPVPAVDW